jgi:plastocyanin
LEKHRPGISALTGLVVIVIIIAGAFYVSIPIVSSGFTASTTVSTSPSSSVSSTNTGSSSGTLTISTKQPIIAAPDVNESISLKFVAIGTVSGNYSLSASSLPKGVTATFQPSTVNLPAQISSTVTMVLSAGKGAAQGNSTVNVVATSGSNVFSSQLSLQSVPALVLIQGNAFTPSSLNVAAGTKVYWLNLDANGGGDVNAAGHDVTALDGTFASGTGNLHQYDIYSFTFTKAGTFKYQSAAQPTMTGEIVVSG